MLRLIFAIWICGSVEIVLAAADAVPHPDPDVAAATGHLVNAYPELLMSWMAEDALPMYGPSHTSCRDAHSRYESLISGLFEVQLHADTHAQRLLTAATTTSATSSAGEQLRELRENLASAMAWMAEHGLLQSHTPQTQAGGSGESGREGVAVPIPYQLSSSSRDTVWMTPPQMKSLLDTAATNCEAHERERFVNWLRENAATLLAETFPPSLSGVADVRSSSDQTPSTIDSSSSTSPSVDSFLDRFSSEIVSLSGGVDDALLPTDARFTVTAARVTLVAILQQRLTQHPPRTDSDAAAPLAAEGSGTPEEGMQNEQGADPDRDWALWTTHLMQVLQAIHDSRNHHRRVTRELHNRLDDLLQPAEAMLLELRRTYPVLSSPLPEAATSNTDGDSDGYGRQDHVAAEAVASSPSTTPSTAGTAGAQHQEPAARAPPEARQEQTASTSSPTPPGTAPATSMANLLEVIQQLLGTANANANVKATQASPLGQSASVASDHLAFPVKSSGDTIVVPWHRRWKLEVDGGGYRAPVPYDLGVRMAVSAAAAEAAVADGRRAPVRLCPLRSPVSTDVVNERNFTRSLESSGFSVSASPDVFPGILDLSDDAMMPMFGEVFDETLLFAYRDWDHIVEERLRMIHRTIGMRVSQWVDAEPEMEMDGNGFALRPGALDAIVEHSSIHDEGAPAPTPVDWSTVASPTIRIRLPTKRSSATPQTDATPVHPEGSSGRSRKVVGSKYQSVMAANIALLFPKLNVLHVAEPVLLWISGNTLADRFRSAWTPEELLKFVRQHLKSQLTLRSPTALYRVLMEHEQTMLLMVHPPLETAASDVTSAGLAPSDSAESAYNQTVAMMESMVLSSSMKEAFPAFFIYAPFPPKRWKVPGAWETTRRRNRLVVAEALLTPDAIRWPDIPRARWAAATKGLFLWDGETAGLSSSGVPQVPVDMVLFRKIRQGDARTMPLHTLAVLHLPSVTVRTPWTLAGRVFVAAWERFRLADQAKETAIVTADNGGYVMSKLVTPHVFTRLTRPSRRGRDAGAAVLLVRPAEQRPPSPAWLVCEHAFRKAAFVVRGPPSIKSSHAKGSGTLPATFAIVSEDGTPALLAELRRVAEEARDREWVDPSSIQGGAVCEWFVILPQNETIVRFRNRVSGGAHENTLMERIVGSRLSAEAPAVTTTMGRSDPRVMETIHHAWRTAFDAVEFADGWEVAEVALPRRLPVLHRTSTSLQKALTASGSDSVKEGGGEGEVEREAASPPPSPSPSLQVREAASSLEPHPVDVVLFYDATCALSLPPMLAWRQFQACWPSALSAAADAFRSHHNAAHQHPDTHRWRASVAMHAVNVDDVVASGRREASRVPEWAVHAARSVAPSGAEIGVPLVVVGSRDSHSVTTPSAWSMHSYGFAVQHLLLEELSYAHPLGMSAVQRRAASAAFRNCTTERLLASVEDRRTKYRRTLL